MEGVWLTVSGEEVCDESAGPLEESLSGRRGSASSSSWGSEPPYSGTHTHVRYISQNYI